MHTDPEAINKALAQAGKLSRPNPIKNPGSSKKTKKALNDMILGALEAKGGQKWLEEQAEKYPIAFMSLLRSLLPYVIQGDANNPIVTEVRRVIVRPPHKAEKGEIIEGVAETIVENE